MKLKEILVMLLQSLVTLAVMAGLVALAAMGTLRGLQWSADQMGYVFNPSTLQFALGWCVAGALCACYWPLRFRSGMQGHWGSFFKGLPLLSLTGPLALVLGYPV